MRRNEWLIVIALLLLTALAVAFVPPTRQAGTAAPTGTPSPTAPAPTLTSTATAVPSATPTNQPARTRATSGPAASATPSATAQPSATPMPSATPIATASPTATPYPFDTRADLERFIYIDQRVQHMFVFERGALLRDIPCSTGLPSDTTYTEAWSGPVGEYWGTFFSFGTYQDDGWYLYKSLGSILVHSLPYTEIDGEKVYQGREYLGVRPSSHGCIRISPEDARWFTEWNPKGVYMVITDPYRELWQ